MLRFQISFPSQFPAAPPLITFSSDIFHPLLTPLTTYTYTTNTSSADPVSASDDERLPPGGFSLRHGFPQWFQRSQRRHAGSRIPSSSTASLSNDEVQSSAPAPVVTVFQVLEYIRSAFSDEDFLDSIPLDAAANSGAYHAWQTYRARQLETSSPRSKQSSPGSRQSSGSASLAVPSQSGNEAVAGRSRKPGEWNWEGVWEERVKRGVQNSLSEPVLFGAATSGDDIVCVSQSCFYKSGYADIL